MSVIVKKPCTRQPQTFVKADAKYGTTFAYVPSVRTPTPVYTGVTKNAGEKGIVDSFLGVGLGTSYVSFGNNAGSNIAKDTPGWMLYLLKVRARDVAIVALASKSDNNGSTGWTCKIDTVGTITQKVVHSSSNALVTSTTGIIELNKYHVVIVTVDGVYTGTTPQRIYVDGVDRTVSSTSGAGTNSADDSYPLWLGRNLFDSGNDAQNIDIALFATGKGKLTSSTIAELSINPWQLFAPQQRTFAVGAAAAAGGFNPYWAMGSNQVIQGNGVQA